MKTDEPRTDFCSEKMLKGFKDDGEDAEALFDSYIKLYNDCLSERPKDFHIGVHLCRGNFVGSRQYVFYIWHSFPRITLDDTINFKILLVTETNILPSASPKAATTQSLPNFSETSTSTHSCSSMILRGLEGLNRFNFSPSIRT